MVAQTHREKHSDPIYANAKALLADFEWFSAVVDVRIKLSFCQECEYESIYQIPPPSIEGDGSPYANFLTYYNLNFEERVIILLALIPHTAPQLLDVFFVKNDFTDRGFTEFGGLKGASHAGFLPTIETAYFVLAGNDLAKRFYIQKYFRSEHFFYAHNILTLDHEYTNEPEASGLLKLSDDFIDYFSTSQVRSPVFSHDFPARRVTTPLDWEDLVLDDFTLNQLEEVKAWLIHGHTLMNDWGMARKLKPGFKILFHGPPGTGKTLTACLFGKFSGTDVYRIDLSSVVSKYIGETAKNLEKVFKRAEHKNWVLFFDEADALLGKRTSISDAHDKYANQEVSYLLQRLEEYAGLVILATNQKGNMDEAFNRRLQSVISFPMPKPKERLKLWQNAFSSQSQFEEGVDLKKIADKFKLSGGSIMNIVRYSSLMALNRDENIIRYNDILEGIKRELEKDGRTV